MCENLACLEFLLLRYSFYSCYSTHPCLQQEQFVHFGGFVNSLKEVDDKISWKCSKVLQQKWRLETVLTKHSTLVRKNFYTEWFVVIIENKKFTICSRRILQYALWFQCTVKCCHDLSRLIENSLQSS